MILVDFSNLTHRIIFASIAQGERNGDLPKLKKGDKHDTEKLRGMFLHLLFSNLKAITDNFSISTSEEVVLCLDSSSWRKDYYPDYKGTRATARDETTVKWGEFYDMVNETILEIKEYFPFKVMQVKKAEGDDIMAIMARHHHKYGRVLIMSEDKDMKQLLEYDNVQMYRPILKEFIKMDMDELKKWRTEHILLGDKSDNIPTIKADSEFTVDFINYLKENNVKEHDVHSFNLRDDSEKLKSEYTGVDKYGVTNIFKAPGFGEKSAEQFVLTGLLQNLRKNKMWVKGFRRNRVLVQFKFIPKHIEQNILDEWDITCNTQTGCNTNKMLEFYNKNSLKQLASSLETFDVVNNFSSLDDWF